MLATGSVFPVNTTCISAKGLLDIFIPKTTTSNQWRHWNATIDLKTCIACLSHHGRIYRKDESIQQEPPLHWFCRCVIEPMKAVEHGGATRDGKNGADYGYSSIRDSSAKRIRFWEVTLLVSGICVYMLAIAPACVENNPHDNARSFFCNGTEDKEIR